MSLSESDTRSKLIDPVLHQRGWTEAHIRREETDGAIEVVGGRGRRRGAGRIDYTLRVIVNPNTQPVAVALIEAKAERLPPGHGLTQAKGYAESRRLNVPFVYSSNGHMFVEFDRTTQLTSDPRPLEVFPTPDELRDRYEAAVGFKLDAPEARPLLTKYRDGESARRYYQDAAIRAVLEKIARGEKRALLSLATGSGKTRIAALLLKRIADAGGLRRALFVCDRTELRQQAGGTFHNFFGADAAEVGSGNPQKNARVLIATYQTLDVDDEEGTTSFLTQNYSENYFSHIVIDECHRSAWGKWRVILDRNPDAVQIGLTATPRQIGSAKNGPDTDEDDEKILHDNIKYFGEPVYEYDIAQGIEDGYLAACEIERRDIFLDSKPHAEQETGVEKSDLEGKRLTDAITGKEVGLEEARDRYEAMSFDDRLQMPDRVKAMCRDLFDRLLVNGGPLQKTIIFCTRDSHADDVANEMHNLYVRWCADHAETPATHYAFKCTAAAGAPSGATAFVGTADFTLSEFKTKERDYFIATTVDLLSTGVDVEPLRTVVFFKYVKSPISFYQMIGRGTRIHIPTDKLMFRVFDYTNATRLFGEEFYSKLASKGPGGDGPQPPPEPILKVEGFEVRITDAGRYIVTEVDGKTIPVTVEEYRERLAKRLVEEVPSLDDFRQRWITPDQRRELLQVLPDAGRSAVLLRTLEDMADCDLYDVLARVGYGANPKTREERAEAFGYKNADWLHGLPPEAQHTLEALVSQFAKAGTEGLENQYVLQAPEVTRAGGLRALQMLGKAADILRETKRRLFAA